MTFSLAVFMDRGLVYNPSAFQRRTDRSYESFSDVIFFV